MKKQLIKKCRLTDRNGRKVILTKPTFGKLVYSEENGRPRIVRTSWFGIKRILLPAVEDRIEMDCQ